MNIVRRFATWQGILKPEQIMGEMPTNEKLYHIDLKFAIGDGPVLQIYVTV